MIELDIKIRSTNDVALQSLIQTMTESLKSANVRGQTDISLSAAIDDNTITVIRKEVKPAPIQ